MSESTVTADLDAMRASALQNLDASIARLRTATEADLARPTRCTGWTVRDLADHQVGTTRLLAGALATLLGQRGVVVSTAADAGTADPNQPLPDRLIAARAVLAEALGALVPADLDARGPLFGPGSDTAGQDVLRLIVAEYGIHRDDLLAAVGESEDLSPIVAATIAELFHANLSWLVARAKATPDAPIAFQFTGPTVRVAVAHDGAAWQTDIPEGIPTIETSGDDTAIARALFGRLPLTDPRLTVVGDPGVAARFKEFIPGP